MASEQARRDGGNLWLPAVAVALVYVIMGVLASMAGEPLLYPYKVPFWPPTGLAVAAAIAWGYRVWPGVLVGALLARWLPPSPVPLEAAAIVALGQAIAVLGGARLYQLVAEPRNGAFAPREVLAFVLTAGLGAPLLAAALSTAAFSAVGITYWSDYWYVTWAWWAKDALSVLVWAPLVFAWREPWPFARTPRTAATALALAGLLMLASLLVFGHIPIAGQYDYPLTYLPILVIWWVAYRFGMQGATAGVAVVTSVAVLGTLSGLGPFVRATRFESMILLQTFMGLVAVATLFFTSLVLARRDAELSLARRTAELEAAQDLDRLKSEFVSNVSHELRTPLASVQGYVEFLEDEVAGPLTPAQREYVGQIHAGSARLTRLVNDLLDFARVSAGTFMLACAHEDLRVRIQESIASVAPQVAGKGLALETDLPEDPVMLRMDGGRIEQVLLNLLGNAIKFTPEGGRVAVRVRATEGGAHVEVSDTGVGIAEEYLDRVFSKFFQAEAGLTRVHGGVGLGLSISRALVEAHGGTMGVLSAPGAGATFWFDLPAEPGAHCAAGNRG